MILPIKNKLDWELTKLIKTTSANVENKLNTTIKSEIKSCSIMMLLSNTKRHIRAHLG